MDTIFFTASEIKYEQLTYCFYCGRSNHNEDKCTKKKEDNKFNKWENSKKKTQRSNSY